MRLKIDSFDKINLSMVNHKSITPHYGTGQSIMTGIRHGEKRYSYRSGVQTDIGDIEVSVWIAVAEWLVNKDNGHELLSQIEEWCSLHNYTEKSVSALRKDALEMYVRQIPDEKKWYDYIRFNSRYYPEKLDDDTLLTVITECCNTPCKVASEQIQTSYTEEPVVPCPLCDSISYFRIIDSQEDGSLENKNTKERRTPNET